MRAKALVSSSRVLCFWFFVVWFFRISFETVLLEQAGKLCLIRCRPLVDLFAARQQTPQNPNSDTHKVVRRIVGHRIGPHQIDVALVIGQRVIEAVVQLQPDLTDEPTQETAPRHARTNAILDRAEIHRLRDNGVIIVQAKRFGIDLFAPHRVKREPKRHVAVRTGFSNVPMVGFFHSA